MKNEPAVDPSRIREEIEGLRSLTTAQLKDKYREVFGEASGRSTSDRAAALVTRLSAEAAERAAL